MEALKLVKYLCVVVIAMLILGCQAGQECPPATNVKSFIVNASSTTNLGSRLPEGYTSGAFSIRPSYASSEIMSLACNGGVRISLFSNAYASQPCLIYFIENIVSIDVRTVKDFDQAHPAGAQVNDLIRVLGDGNGLQTISELLPLSGLAEYTYIDFYFVKKPSDLEPHYFILDIELDSGVIYSVKTAGVDFSLLGTGTFRE